jgi:ribosomal protein L28
MALQNITFANRRSHRAKVASRAFAPGVVRTTQVINPTGAAVAVRPRRTALRYMNNAGQGSVGYV